MTDIRRRELLAAGGSLTFLATAGCFAPASEPAEPDRRPRVDEVQHWPMFLFDETNRRCFAGESRIASDTPTWTREIEGSIWGSPVVVDGTLYIGSYDRHLYALSAETGAVKWRYRTGDRIDGTPAVVDGTVYVGSFDRNVYALDAETGEEQWIHGTDGIVRSSPTVVDETVYIGVHCRVEECTRYYDVSWPKIGYLYAFDAEDGSVRWRYEVEDGILGKPAVADGTVIIGSSDGTIYGIDAETGTSTWEVDTGPQVIASPVVADGVAYASSIGADLFAIDIEDGETRWESTIEDRPSEGQLTQTIVTSSPTVCGDTMYIGSLFSDSEIGSQGWLNAVSTADGSTQWTAGPFAEMVGSSPTVVDDIVYVGAHTMEPVPGYEPGVFAVREDGSTSWQYVVDSAEQSGFGSSPTIAAGHVYISSSGGRVHAFEMEDRPAESPS